MNENIVIIDSIAMAKSEHKGKVIVAGSHGALVAAEHYAYPVQPKLVFFNDAGKSKNEAALGGVKWLGEHGIASASVDTMTGMIGNGMDEYENGVISFVNPIAESMGLRVGMAVKDAVAMALDK